MSGILVDTCIWSLAFRGKTPRETSVASELAQLIEQNEIRIIGPVRQEVLSGYSNKNSYEKLRQKLIYFPNTVIHDADYERAAEYSNLCRAHGIQGSHTDFLICAVAARARYEIFTSDKDFSHYAKQLPITLYKNN